MSTNGLSSNSKAVHHTITQANDNRPKPPKFTDKHKEREYVKFRLAQAFRIFGEFSEVLTMYGFLMLYQAIWDMTNA